MIGNNVMQLNQATIIEAVEYWLHQVVLSGDMKLKVNSISEDPNTRMFVIKISDVKPPE